MVGTKHTFYFPLSLLVDDCTNVYIKFHKLHNKNFSSANVTRESLILSGSYKVTFNTIEVTNCVRSTYVLLLPVRGDMLTISRIELSLIDTI